MIKYLAQNEKSFCAKLFFNLLQTIFHLAQIDFMECFSLTNMRKIPFC